MVATGTTAPPHPAGRQRQLLVRPDHRQHRPRSRHRRPPIRSRLDRAAILGAQNPNTEDDDIDQSVHEALGENGRL